jgi:hypothetical protein
MKTFTNCAAQGDVVFRRSDKLPSGLTEVAPVNGQIIVTHSETGHNHVMVLDRKRSKVPAVQMYATDNPLVAWIKVNRRTALEHLRQHDTHEPIMFGVGVYEVRRQREHSPEGWRRVQD